MCTYRKLGIAALQIVGMMVFAGQMQAQNNQGVKRPKLVVGIVVDQMRWDFLYRYADRYGQGGFKRMLNEGFTAENTMIPYAQTVTAAGHATIYTGTTPAVHGIMGNEWYDPQKDKVVYCVEDDAVKIVGGVANSEPMSPANLAVTTVSDELRLATNFRAKVVGIALKDRGSILPAGHTGTAYWYESTNGNWVSSTHYMNSLPKWVNDFNAKRWVDTFYTRNWNTLFPVNSYTQSDDDNVPYEGLGATFPKKLTDYIGKNYSVVRSTPYGNSLTLEFAKTAIRSEALGADGITDLLAVSISSPDYIGHQYGPNSIEVEDTYLRLDRELEEFFKYLDKQVGKGEYTVFLSADHGVAHVPAFLKKHKINVSTIANNRTELNVILRDKFGIDGIIKEYTNYQLYLDHHAIDSARKNKEEIIGFLVAELKKLPFVANAFSYANIENVIMPREIKEMFIKGYNPKLGGDIQLVIKSGNFYGGNTGTTHGSWYPYDAHIPMVWMGWGIPHGHTTRTTYMTDIAPTLSALLKIQMPSGNIGNPVFEMLDKK